MLMTPLCCVSTHPSLICLYLLSRFRWTGRFGTLYICLGLALCGCWMRGLAGLSLTLELVLLWSRVQLGLALCRCVLGGRVHLGLALGQSGNVLRCMVVLGVATGLGLGLGDRVDVLVAMVHGFGLVHGFGRLALRCRLLLLAWGLRDALGTVQHPQHALGWLWSPHWLAAHLGNRNSFWTVDARLKTTQRECKDMSRGATAKQRKRVVLL